MSKIAFIGMGAMGSRMAARLITAGHELTVFNRTASKAEALDGAGVAETPAAAAAEAELVMTMVADPDALMAVTLGEDGFAAGFGPGATAIDLSTVGPAGVRAFAASLPKASEVLEAPVLGSIQEAESGTLQLFVGGPREGFERWRGVLGALGNPTYIGGLGSGAAAKLMANSTLFGVLGVLGEAVALGQALGVSRSKILEVLSLTPIAAQAEGRRAALEAQAVPTRFPLSLARKDADLIAATAGAAGLDLPVGAGARRWLAAAEAEQGGEADYSRLLATIIEP